MHAEQVTITVRYSAGAYTARAKGHKVTASCSMGARSAARRVAAKLGLDPEKLQISPESTNDVRAFTITKEAQ